MNEKDDQTDTEDEQLARRARALFDASVESLDAATLSRLNRSRQLVLEKAGAEAGFRTLSPWVPAAALAAVAFFAVVLWSGQRVDEQVLPDATASGSDIEILLNDDNLEMLSELEFYSWIDLETDPVADEEAESNVG